jgi:hypothetical protein
LRAILAADIGDASVDPSRELQLRHGGVILELQS